MIFHTIDMIWFVDLIFYARYVLIKIYKKLNNAKDKNHYSAVNTKTMRKRKDSFPASVLSSISNWDTDKTKQSMSSNIKTNPPT